MPYFFGQLEDGSLKTGKPSPASMTTGWRTFMRSGLLEFMDECISDPGKVAAAMQPLRMFELSIFVLVVSNHALRFLAFSCLVVIFD